MSANNFARPQWVADLIRSSGLEALPQYTYTDYHARDDLMTQAALTQLLIRSQTEYCWLTGVTDKLEKTNECLKAGTYSIRKRKDLDQEEQEEFTTSLDNYDKEVFEYPSKETMLDELEEQHQLIVNQRKNVQEAETENARLREEATGKPGAGTVEKE
ncbi:hypothetical protein G7Y79_00058g091560 [Physcia stellaris]|nr:hypothetical protein G7Y79_00058g091560 [Physcia stellaris]